MIRSIHKRIAEELGTVACKTDYTFFQNPENCGANFKWKYFVRVVHRMTFLFLYFKSDVWKRFTKKDKKELELIKYKAIAKQFKELTEAQENK
jgi:hypothetical protein